MHDEARSTSKVLLARKSGEGGLNNIICERNELGTDCSLHGRSGHHTTMRTLGNRLEREKHT